MIITKDNINQFINNNDWDDKDIMNCGNMGVTKIDYIPQFIDDPSINSFIFSFVIHISYLVFLFF